MGATAKKKLTALDRSFLAAESRDVMMHVFGFIGCRDTVPHLQRLAVYTGEAAKALDV